MTRLEYYGFKNLRFNSYCCGSIQGKNDIVGKNVIATEIYYKPKHANRDILLRRFTTDEGRDEIDVKARWLLGEALPYKNKSRFYYSGPLVDEYVKPYKMRHCKIY